MADDGLCAALAAVVQRVEALEKETVRLSGENAALRRCLEASGLLRWEAINAQNHRISFDSMWAREENHCPANAADTLQPPAFAGRCLVDAGWVGGRWVTQNLEAPFSAVSKPVFCD